MPTILLSAAILLAVGYAVIIFLTIKCWNAIEDWTVPPDWESSTFATIIIPARNEAGNISNCINSILEQKFPLKQFEIIVIDDHSEDDTAAIVENYASTNIRLLKIKDFPELKGKHYKKAAIELGIEKAKGKLIITTDADCIAPKKWLALIISFFEKKEAKFIAAPVNFHQEKNTFERFQSLDYIGMMGVAGAGIYSKKLSLCNGANLAYSKEAFLEIGGFEGINQIASGDDMLLLEKFQQIFPNDIYFLKNREATINTRAESTLKGFINQRLRWAAKTSHYKNQTTVWVQTWVGAFSLGIFIALLLIPFLGVFALRLFVYALCFKAIVDFFYLKKMSNFFGRPDLMRHFLSAQFWHLFYIVRVGIGSFFAKNTIWKGRKI